MKLLRGRMILSVAAVVALATGGLASAAMAHPDHQHGDLTGHLIGTGEWGDIELLGVARVTDQPEIVADVTVDPSGNYAYLAHWGRPDCGARSEAGGRNNPDAGAWVIDISDLTNPQVVTFIPSSQDSRPGEGMQALDISTRFFQGTLLVMNNEHCGPQGKGGVTLYDVTDPSKPKMLSKHFGDRGFADTNDIHSAFAWQAGNNAYLVMVDNFEFPDVDILDISNPKRPRLIAEYDLNDFGVVQPELGLTESFIHDMVVKEIDGRFIMLVSYWDGGWVLLDVTDPRNAIYLGDTDYAEHDPLLMERTGIEFHPEGNAHQAEFTADNRFFIGTDEDFAPYGAVFSIDTGQNAGEYPAGEFGFTPPVNSLPDGELNGPVVYGGYGCPGISVPQRSDYDLDLAAGEEAILVLQRGPVGDPSAAGEACFFSEKIEAAQDAGWDAVIIANHHAGSEGGAHHTPVCGSQGHAFTPTIPAVCVGHAAFHLMFNTEPNFTYPEAEPAIGQVGERVSHTPVFNGWGYVHLFDAETLEELDQFAVPEAHDPAFAFGFGDLTVHEVATHPTEWDQAYLSYYAAGLRSIEIQCTNPADSSTCSLVETGGYLDPLGNNFWGVEVFIRDGRTIILASDRDSGLWIFEDVGLAPQP